MAVTSMGEEEDPTSRYQNPRYSGKGVPDRGNNSKRKVTWHVHNTDTGEYLGSLKGGQTAPKKAQAIGREVSREGHSMYGVPSKRKQF